MFLEELANDRAERCNRLLHVIELFTPSLTASSGTHVYAHLCVTETHPEMAFPRCISIRLSSREHPARREQNSRFGKVNPELHFKAFLVAIE